MSKKRVLIVEDEPSLSATIASLVTTKGFEASVASNGKEARDMIVLENFDLVISDIRMPFMNGIELLHFINKTKPIPVILMTGFAEISETKEAYELGAKGFLAKPFSKNDLFEQITNILGEIKPPEEDFDPLYTGLKIDEFISGNEIKYDIFLRINKSKYIKVANSGESMDIGRIKKYNSMGLTHLYLRKEDFRAYCGFTLKVASKVANSSNIVDSKKASFIQDTSRSLLGGLYHDQLDESNFSLASEVVNSTLSVLCQNANTLQVLDSLKNHDDRLFSHSMAVSLYATLIAKALGWNSLKTRIQVSMCGLFHDIGLKEIPKEILDKSRSERTLEETRIFETHSQRGLEILNSLRNIPPEISQVAMQHHEDCQGFGYPMKLSRGKISSLAKLIAVVDEFCSLAYPTNQSEPYTPQEALERVVLSNMGKLDATYLKALQDLFEEKKVA